MMWIGWLVASLERHLRCKQCGDLSRHCPNNGEFAVSRPRHASGSKIAQKMAQRIASLRKAQGLTLEEVAERSGMSKSHVWETENGKATNPTIDTAVRLSRTLGCSLDFLCGIESKKPDLHPEAMRVACEIDVLLRGKQKSKSRI